MTNSIVNLSVKYDGETMGPEVIALAKLSNEVHGLHFKYQGNWYFLVQEDYELEKVNFWALKTNTRDFGENPSPRAAFARYMLHKAR